MKSILFISSEKNRDILETYKNNHKDELSSIKRLTGYFEINDYINGKINFFENFTFLILDRLAFNNNDRDFVEAIKKLYNTIEKTRILIIWQGFNHESNDGVFLIKNGITNLIINENIQENIKEIEEATTEKGIIKYQSINDIKTTGGEKYLFKNDNYSILILNTDHRMLATTYSLSLCNFLAKVGAETSYVTLKDEEEINIIRRIYENNEKEIEEYKYQEEIDDRQFIELSKGFKYLNLVISTENIPSQFTILDASGLPPKRILEIKDYIKQADKILLFCELNEWQIDRTRTYIEKLTKIREDLLYNNNAIDIIINNSKKDEIDKNIKIFNDIVPKTLIEQDGIFDWKKNRNYFYALVEKQIIGIATA